jgi:hypothetical protein
MLKKLKILAGRWSYPNLRGTPRNISQPMQLGPNRPDHTPDRAPDRDRNPETQARNPQKLKMVAGAIPTYATHPVIYPNLCISASTNKTAPQTTPHTIPDIPIPKPETRNSQKLKKRKILAGRWSYSNLRGTPRSVSQPVQPGPNTRDHTPDRAPDRAQHSEPQTQTRQKLKTAGGAIPTYATPQPIYAFRPQHTRPYPRPPHRRCRTF